MATTQPEPTTQGQQDPSSGLTLNLSSNNPFRNRAVSPSLRSPVSPFDDPPPRPVSRNPFLDPTAIDRSPKDFCAPNTMGDSTGQKVLTPEDIFGSLTIEDKEPPSNPPGPRPDGAKAGPPTNRQGPPGRENVPPPGMRRGPPPGHRLTRSQEEALRARRAQGQGGGGPVDVSRSPQRRPDRRPRRNSDTSVMEAEKKPLTEEERKEREERRRARERRHREGKDKKPVNRKMDIIDQLDATSIFGTGLFHHDGPFDALNPHRNRQGSRRLAPMQAFPKDSLNNAIGGSGPLQDRPDHALFMGNADKEAFEDYSSGAKPRSGSKGDVPVFDPTSRGEILHGDVTLGLGTSTFLEGTPAARTAIQRREEERATDGDGGLQRKKSLAQRIRNINRAPRDFQPSGRLTNPENAYGRRRSPSDTNSTPGSMPNPGSERNPFFQEFDTGKRSEENFTLGRGDGNGEVRTVSSPRRGSGLERRATSDSATSPDDGQPKQGSGLLARVKSLKSGRRPRPGPPDSAAPPGQAV